MYRLASELPSVGVVGVAGVAGVERAAGVDFSIELPASNAATMATSSAGPGFARLGLSLMPPRSPEAPASNFRFLLCNERSRAAPNKGTIVRKMKHQR